MRAWMLAAVIAALPVAVAAGEEVNHFFGYVYDLDSNRHLYTEVHSQRMVDGEWAGGSTEYVMADGRRFGRKTYDFTGDRFLPVYRLDLHLEGYAEAITSNGPRIGMLRQRPGKQAETAQVEKDGQVASDTGLVRLLAANFDRLMAGEKVKFRIAAPSRLETYKFRARRIGDTTFEGRPAVRFQADMDSMLNLFVGPLVFTFDAGNRRIREFRGTTNIRNPSTGEDYKVRIAYYSEPPDDAIPPPEKR